MNGVNRDSEEEHNPCFMLHGFCFASSDAAEGGMHSLASQMYCFTCEVTAPSPLPRYTHSHNHPLLALKTMSFHVLCT